VLLGTGESPMRFSVLRLENWRNFAAAGVSLQNRAFLVGPNASGKSNFLDALRFLRDVATPGTGGRAGGLQDAIARRGGLSRIRSLSARRTPDVAIEVEISEDDSRLWRYRLSFGMDSRSHRALVRSEVVERAGQTQPVLNRPDEKDRKDPERLLQTNLEQITANPDFRDVAEFLSSVTYYHIVPQLVRDPERSAGRSGDPYGGDFLERIARTPPKTRDARLRRIQEALSVAVPQLGQLRLERDEAGKPHLKGNYQHWRARGAWQTETEFSDGTLRLLGLLWTLLDGTGPVLLEEPELSLHPEVVRHIPGIIASVQRKRSARQVILSTHSSELLSDEGIAADEIFVFTPSAEGTTVSSGANLHDVRRLLEAGLPASEVVLPRTVPPEVQKLRSLKA